MVSHLTEKKTISSIVLPIFSCANNFNKYFSEAASGLVANLHPSNKSPFNSIPLNNANFDLNNIPLTENEILEATFSLKDKMTQDFNGISSHLIKKKHILNCVPYFTYF